MIVTTKLSDEELVVLWHRTNFSITNTEYQTEDWRQKFHDNEYGIGWTIYTAVTKELKKRKIDPHTYFNVASPSPILISGMEVEFAENGKSIEIGCEKVSYDTVHEIYTRIVNKRNEYVKFQE